MKKILFVALMVLGIGKAHAANMMDCTSDRGWNQNFGLTTQMDNGYYECEDRLGNRTYLRFDGLGPGLGINVEAFKLVFLGLGDGLNATYVGVRVQASAILGANVMTAVGTHGLIQTIGVNFGIGVDPSLVKIVVRQNSSEVLRKNKSDKQ